MATYIILTAFILCWLWIELSLFFVSKLVKKEDSKFTGNTVTNYGNRFSFVWRLRIIAFTLLLLIFVYMNYFEKVNFEKAIEFCLGIIR